MRNICKKLGVRIIILMLFISGQSLAQYSVQAVYPVKGPGCNGGFDFKTGGSAFPLDIYIIQSLRDLLQSSFEDESELAKLPFSGKLFQDLKHASDDFLQYVLSHTGQFHSYDLLKAFPSLRTDVRLLEALDRTLVGKSPSEIAELNKIIGKVPDETTGRKIIAAITANEGRIFRVITTNIREALDRRISHIMSIEMKRSGSGYKFTGVHSKRAIDAYSPNAHIVHKNPLSGPATPDDIYEVEVYAKAPNGMEIPKSGFGGKSTFFPDSWSQEKILEEVEHAVMNNRGYDPNTKRYFGYSKDLSIKIEFAYNPNTGEIATFFPSLN